MSWAEHHKQSEQFASSARMAARGGERDRASNLYQQAAEAEVRAIQALDLSKARTLGITAVSAAALWYKARKFQQAEHLAHYWLASSQLPDFAIDQLKDLLQTIWGEVALERAGVRFVGDEVLVSVKGGKVVTGGAPLDLVLLKVEQVSKLFLRTVEWLVHVPHRKREAPNPEVEALCQPWVFQAAPGSYQFAIRVQEPAQQEMFRSASVESKQVSAKVIEIIRASVDDPEQALSQVVPDPDYRATFLRMARNIAPTGQHTSFNQVEFRQAGIPDDSPIILRSETQQGINKVLRKQATKSSESEKLLEEKQFLGVLRNLSLDNDWLDIVLTEDQGHKKIRIHGAGDMIDDVVGPMVNRMVLVDTWRVGDDKYRFRDIQLTE